MNELRKKINTNRVLQVTLILLGLTMLTAGLLHGEALDVFRKAIFICMECIGIG